MARLSHTVELSRLAFGAWCHASEKQLGEGDIRASYSADRIGMGQPVRKPFRYAGELWVCVGTSPSGAEAYRLVDPSLYGGTARSYHERCRYGDRARGDPAGFPQARWLKAAVSEVDPNRQCSKPDERT